MATTKTIGILDALNNRQLSVWAGESSESWIIIAAIKDTNKNTNVLVNAVKGATCVLKISDALYQSKATRDSLQQLADTLLLRKTAMMSEDCDFSKVSITLDCNDDFRTRGYSVLSEKEVIKTLDAYGIDHSSYTYSELKVDNSNSVALSFLTNIVPDESIEHDVEDTSKYAGYDLRYPEFWKKNLIGGRNLMLFGPAGTGKTTEVLTAAEKYHVPVTYVNFTEDTDESIYRGKVLPNTKDDKTPWTLVESKIAKSIQKPGITFIGEAMKGRSALMGVANTLTDGTGYLELEDGTVVRRDDNNVIIFDANPNYLTSNDMEESLVNRFKALEFEGETEESFLNKVHVKFGFNNDAFNSKFYECITKYTDFLRSSNLLRFEVSFRQSEYMYQDILTALNIDGSVTKDDIISSAVSTLMDPIGISLDRDYYTPAFKTQLISMWSEYADKLLPLINMGTTKESDVFFKVDTAMDDLQDSLEDLEGIDALA